MTQMPARSAKQKMELHVYCLFVMMEICLKHACHIPEAQNIGVQQWSAMIQNSSMALQTGIYVILHALPQLHKILPKFTHH